MENNEVLFYNKLKDIFIGAKIEGNSGFINLMRIKSNYFDVVFKELSKEINEKIKEFPEFREEMFDKLYTFFNTYFSESGSIYFTYTPLKSKIYDKIYTNQDDVILFWKTRMLYYVKTDKLWNNLSVEYEKNGLKYKVYFDCSKLEHKSGNEKKDIVYELGEVKDTTINFYVKYSERGNTTKTSEIIKEFKRNEIYLDENDLDKIFKIFEKQNEVDYFINKNAKEFLREQFDLWLKNYIFDDDSDFSEKRIKELKILKEIAFKIIDFVSQFEDELVKIWNKPKFVINSNYVITLDRIANKENGIYVIEKILNHKNIDKQIEEWKDLGIVDDKFDKNNVLKNILIGKELSKEYQFLPIDTKYFKDLELEILSLFDDLDSELDGWLIHSENYQALNTILPKFKGKVKTIYIDPPYNTGSDEFIYKDRFQDSSWLTMVENRLYLAKELMAEDGIIFTSIGDTTKSYVSKASVAKLQLLHELVFTGNYVATFCRKSGIAPRQDVKFIANSNDYILSYAKNIDKLTLNRKKADRSKFKYKDEHYNERGAFNLNKLDRGSENYSDSLDYPIIIRPGDVVEIYENGKIEKKKINENIEIWPGGNKEDKRWIFRWSKDKVSWGINNDYIVFSKDSKGKWKVYYKEYELVDNTGSKRESSTPYNSLILDFPNERGSSELADLFSKRVFEYPKPSDLIKYLLETGSNNNSIILDFFAGSGTTAHAVMKLNKEDGSKRKFILVEMSDYFYDIIIPRLKKIAFSLNWKEMKPINNDGISTFFKYYDLEQYEQTLRKCHYIPSEPFFNLDDKSIYQQYIFMKDPKLLDFMELDYANNKIKINFDKIYPNIDIAETLSLIKGMWIKKIGKDHVLLKDDNGNEVKIDYNNIDFKMIKPLIWW